MKGGINLSKEHISISNAAFIELLNDAMNFDVEEFKEDTLKQLSEELNKPKWEQDYIAIHECFLTLSECFGYKYDNEYERLAERQQRKYSLFKKIKASPIGEIAMF